MPENAERRPGLGGGAAALINHRGRADRSRPPSPKQASLFAPPKPTPKQEVRRLKAAWRVAVERWATGVLMHDLLLEYADPADELTVISVVGSGPPTGWRRRILDRLAADLGDQGLPENATDPALVNLAIRLGRLPRSILATMPPRPPELAP
jgi:hypothetical protein